jgi:hypothetical protein
MPFRVDKKMPEEKKTLEFDPTQYYGDPMFYEIVEELKQLHSRKNFQYATQGNPLGNFERVGRLAKKLFKEHVPEDLGSAMLLMGKQIDAVYEMVGEGKSGTVEELEDKFKDMAAYSVICMILVRKAKAIKEENLESLIAKLNVPSPISPFLKLELSKELLEELGIDVSELPTEDDFRKELEKKQSK